MNLPAWLVQAAPLQRRAIRQSAERGRPVVRTAAAEADIETTAQPVGEEDPRIEDFKTGVAHVWGVRGSPDKVCNAQALPNA